jgi:hypothetical protein
MFRLQKTQIHSRSREQFLNNNNKKIQHLFYLAPFEHSVRESTHGQGC